jgi:hypothetical protein
MREDPYPDFSAPFDVTRHRDTGGFNLSCRNPAALGGLETKFPKSHSRTPAGLATHTTFLQLSVFNPLRH